MPACRHAGEPGPWWRRVRTPPGRPPRWWNADHCGTRTSAAAQLGTFGLMVMMYGHWMACLWGLIVDIQFPDSITPEDRPPSCASASAPSRLDPQLRPPLWCRCEVRPFGEGEVLASLLGTLQVALQDKLRGARGGIPFPSGHS